MTGWEQGATAPGPFCACGHSWYSHSYPMRVVRDPMRLECERVGCRCGEYAPADPETHVSGRGDER